MPPYGRRVWLAVVGGWVAVVVLLIAWTGFVLCWCAACLLVGRAVVVRARPHAGACCVGVWPPPLWGVLPWFVAPLMVGRAVLVRGPPHGGACCVGAHWPRWWCVVWWCLAWVVVICWVAVVVVLFALPDRCCAGACPPPPCLGLPCLCVATPLMGRAVSTCQGFSSRCCSRFDARLVLLVRCCLCLRMASVVRCWLSVVSVWPGLVLCWCVPPPRPFVGACRVCAWLPPMVRHAVLVSAPAMVGPAALVCGPPHVRACYVVVWPPSWWGVLCWCLPVAVVVRGLVWWCLALVVVVCWVGCGCGSFACLAGVSAVLARARPPPLLRRALFVCGPPVGGACGVRVFQFWFVVL